MNQYNLQLLAQKIKIVPINIIRENIELEILNTISATKFKAIS